MGLVEDKLWEECTVKPTERCRFIHDNWGLWPHGKDSFISFMQILNNLYPNELEFTYVFDYKTITFLDVCIKRTGQGYLDTDLYVKPSFKNLYLHYDSYHNRYALDNIAYGQALRIKSICSQEKDLRRNLEILEHNLSERGTTGEKFRINDDISCNTIGVVYLINCIDCNKQYVGETGLELRSRHRGHRQEFRKRTTPLGKHFENCRDFELIVLEKVKNNCKRIRKEAEFKWIYRLNTFKPEGINIKEVKLKV
ncbi:hypothetical protein HOLleu_32589 [Holothuria leucospilota]|uniref:GIY-YIG domain-containing protein n=1 Tax=Holothuria leucospilota TaxID=206669 RepID=A0A9Q1BIX0_HOLLE|nr:hypothetical protein HOLleu_32589 [Holothuria leucospilota]